MKNGWTVQHSERVHQSNISQRLACQGLFYFLARAVVTHQLKHRIFPIRLTTINNARYDQSIIFNRTNEWHFIEPMKRWLCLSLKVAKFLVGISISMDPETYMTVTDARSILASGLLQSDSSHRRLKSYQSRV